MRKLIGVFLLSTCALFAQAPRNRTLWKASMFTLGAVNALDIQSSWGKHELNPTLAGGGNATFGARSALVKVGLQGSLMGLEYVLTRGRSSHRLYKALAIVNFGAAAGVGAVAAHNYTIGRPIR